MSGELRREFGDYQTPIKFAEKVCNYLKSIGVNPSALLEPTCGIGNFIKEGLNAFDNVAYALGVEINAQYCDSCKNQFKNSNVEIVNENFFSFNSNEKLKDFDEILILGNPPWAMNSDLRYNLPIKENFKKLCGTDAITGASNFDICEYMILKMLKEFQNTNTTVAMLCKTSVARNVFTEICRKSLSTEYIRILNVDANEIFGISASACLLVISLRTKGNTSDICRVSNFDTPNDIIETISCKNGLLSIVRSDICDLSGESQLEWRQGVKHDCASVMELKQISENVFRNKNGEEINLELRYIYPLMKSSHFKSAIINQGFKKHVLVTQKKAREDTTHIETDAPLTWRYLKNHEAAFAKRKSSIYFGAPAFSMFGVGDYSYSKYKVGVSGFYKKPLFSLVYNQDNIDCPVMMDDTAYFLSFTEYDTAYVCMLLLNCETVQNFLYCISFKDSKRPYTKKVLQRLDLIKAFSSVSFEELVETEFALSLSATLTIEMLLKARDAIENGSQEELSAQL